MVALITLPKDNKELFTIIEDQIYFAGKVDMVQTRYLVPNLGKHCWNENNSLKRYCIVIISVSTMDAS